MGMTNRERILAAIQRKTVDRIPLTFRASKYLTTELMEHFGFEEPGDFAGNRTEFLHRLGADFWASGSKVDKYSTFMPAYHGEKPRAPYVDDGTFFYTVGIHSKPGNMQSWDIAYPNVGVDPPLAGAESPSDIEKEYLLSRIDLYDFSTMQNKYHEVRVADLVGDSNAVVNIGTLSSMFMMCCYLRGMENFLMDLAYNPKLASRLVGEVCEFVLEFNRRELEAMGDAALYYGTWDDVAGQNGMMFSPHQFRTFFLPYYRRLIEQCKKRELFFGWHVCGSVHEVLPMMIDAGIDVFDVVQTSARDMDIETVHDLYGGEVCLHGGLDVQKLLVEKSEQEVRDEVRRIMDLWGAKGGIILAPSHEALPDTPVENMLAIYDTVRGG
jgi:uroporphyrinogen decarboxylase